MQWQALGETEAHAPLRGELEPSLLRALVAHLAARTATPDDCGLGTWEGWGDLDVSPFGATLELPLRTYLLAEGPIARALELGRSPNLLWPRDRAWFPATEIDFDSTLVGGDRDLADAILADPLIEAACVG
jgi:hypothetical protein